MDDEVLRDDAPTAGPAGAVEYDCSPWAGETRRILRSVLIDREIPHAWEGTVLVVPLEVEEIVDGIVDEVEMTAKPSLGTARSTVAYELAAWSAPSLNRLVDLLVKEKIPHEWDAEGDLLVHEEDAEAAEEVIAELGEPDGGDELDGLEINDRLGRLFVASDRLANDPTDRTGIRDIADSYESIEHAAVPFGVDAGVWLELHRCAVGLIDAVAGAGAGERDTHEFDDDSGEEHSADDAGDDVATSHAADGEGPEGAESAPSVQAQARALRDLLRRFV